MENKLIELYDHQKDALAKLKNGNILVGGVGSGKSATSIAYYVNREFDKDLYIITTAKKRDSMDWEDELIRFDLTLNPNLNRNNKRIIIDSWNNISKYKAVKDSFFIFDEQRVVGKGAWVKAFIKIAKVNRWILLSATPGDTYEDYIPVFVANGFYKNRTEFLDRHAVWNPYTKYPQIDKFIDRAKLNALRHRILVPMSDPRRTVRVPIKCVMDYDKILYKKIWKDRWDPYENEPIQEISKLCHLLRRVVNTDKSRLEKLKELTQEHKKIIVFYNYDYELDLMHAALESWGIPYSEWNGHKHQDILDSDTWVYLCQYTAAAEAWNCIETNVIVFYSQTYSYKTKEQASGRIDRMNTPFTHLYYYNFVSYAPIDVGISRSLDMKRNFNETAFINGENDNRKKNTSYNRRREKNESVSTLSTSPLSVSQKSKMSEAQFQKKLITEIKDKFPDCIVMKNDPTYIQGIPDLTVLHGKNWATLECKKDSGASHRPNQDYYVEKMNDMSYSAFIYPENKEVILDGMAQSFKGHA